MESSSPFGFPDPIPVCVGVLGRWGVFPHHQAIPKFQQINQTPQVKGSTPHSRHGLQAPGSSLCPDLLTTFEVPMTSPLGSITLLEQLTELSLPV